MYSMTVIDGEEIELFYFYSKVAAEQKQEELLVEELNTWIYYGDPTIKVGDIKVEILQSLLNSFTKRHYNDNIPNQYVVNLDKLEFVDE